MANVSHALSKAFLEWSLALQVTAPTRPVGSFIGLSLGAPTTVSSSEIGVGSGYVRASATWNSPVATPAGSATVTNTVAVTYGPFSNAQSISGAFISDTVSSNAGTLLWYGNLAVARTVAVSDQLVINSGALTVTMN